jgi:single-stranded-DNA-specific exonuclease
VGAGGLHLKLDLMQESQPYRQIAAIGFNMAEYFDHIKAGNPIDICYSIVENFYRGSSTVQLRLKDIRERDELI